MEGGVKKIGFSLASKKKTKKYGSTVTGAQTVAFGDPDEDQNSDNEEINNDIPKQPLIIPCQKDSRKSLQEQARARRENEQSDVVQRNNDPASMLPKPENEDENDNLVAIKVEDQQKSTDDLEGPAQTDEDRAAIQALEREAAAAQGKGDGFVDKGTNKRVIASTGDTFQRQSAENDNDQRMFEESIKELPADISVKSQVYKTVPISEFGAAMLRGMGWSGNNDNGTKNGKKQLSDPTTMPRPSRLGLGATPKMMGSEDLPETHSRRKPRRHDQLQREERLKQQQEEMAKERQRQLSLDKQRVLQLGSIVSVCEIDGEIPRKGRQWAMIKKLTGVPGLNMILVQYEGDTTPSKVKKGSVKLVERTDLNERPFQHTEEKDQKRNGDKPRSRKEESVHGDNKKRDTKDESNGYDRSRDRKRSREKRHTDFSDGYSSDRDRYKRKSRDDRRHDDDKKRHKSKRSVDSNSSSYNRGNPSATSLSWLISNIRVRVISSKYGRNIYKEKGIVVDVSRKGVATLKMGDGQVINVAERHLETALPKVGGRSIILSGDHRFSKGRLLERDSKKNRGIIQVYEDMSVVTTSLDDMAEWCGPLDDDLEH